MIACKEIIEFVVANLEFRDFDDYAWLYYSGAEAGSQIACTGYGDFIKNGSGDEIEFYPGEESPTDYFLLIKNGEITRIDS